MTNRLISLLQVLSHGTLLEFDSPHVLLSNSKSEFTSLVNQTGAAESEYLRTLANIASIKVKSNGDNDNDDLGLPLEEEEEENLRLII